MSPFCKHFITYQSILLCTITTADKWTFYAIGTGDLQIEVPNGQSTTKVLLQDALHAPDMGVTIVSISWITNAGCTVSFEKDTCTIRNQHGVTIGIIPPSSNGLYKVECTYVAAASAECIDLLMLHQCLGHIAPSTIHTLMKSSAIEGIQLINNRSAVICDSCKYAKTMCKLIQKERDAPLADALGVEVHTDLWGPLPTPSLGGCKYYVTFTDDHTCYTSAKILHSKDQMLSAYKAYAVWVHTQHGVWIKQLCSNRGGEYTGTDFTVFLQGEGTKCQLITHNTPQHNGVAKALNHQLVECMHVLLHQSGLPKTLWAKALLYAVWLKNCTLTCALGTVMPYECLHKSKPNLASVPEWGQ